MDIAVLGVEVRDEDVGVKTAVFFLVPYKVLASTFRRGLGKRKVLELFFWEPKGTSGLKKIKKNVQK